MKAGTLSASGWIRPHLTPLEYGIIFGGIPTGAISRKIGLIWGIPVSMSSNGTRGLNALSVYYDGSVGFGFHWACLLVSSTSPIAYTSSDDNSCSNRRY